MDVKDLKKHLDVIRDITDEVWLSTLDQRKLEELSFHDQHRDTTVVEEMGTDTFDKFYGNKKYYSSTQASKDYTQKWIKNNCKGKVFLDYACGNGSNAIVAAQAGAKLSIGLDISRISVENAQRAAKLEGVESNTYFLQADAENTKLPDSSIDVIICSGMLHHLDLAYAFPELNRILAPKGKILAVEALDYNPFIKLYRNMTPAMRTNWEKNHILSLKDVKFASRFFNVEEIKYWHIVGYLGAILKPLSAFLNKFDAILTKIPLVKYMAWIFTFELHSKKEVR